MSPCDVSPENEAAQVEATTADARARDGGSCSATVPGTPAPVQGSAAVQQVSAILHLRTLIWHGSDISSNSQHHFWRLSSAHRKLITERPPLQVWTRQCECLIACPLAQQYTKQPQQQRSPTARRFWIRTAICSKGRNSQSSTTRTPQSLAFIRRSRAGTVTINFAALHLSLAVRYQHFPLMALQLEQLALLCARVGTSTAQVISTGTTAADSKALHHQLHG
jgi:hypothetical protein